MTVYRRPDPIPLRQPERSSRAVLSAIRADPEDLNRLVAREIFHAIATGKFPAGEIMPKENELATDLGVSRTALREAIKGLAAKGIVETRRKRGTRVLDRTHWNMLDVELISWSRREGSQRVSEQLWAALVETQPAIAAQAAGLRNATQLEETADAFSRATSDAVRRAAFGQLLVDLAVAGGNRFLLSLTVSCVRGLLSDDPGFVDRKLTGMNGDAIARLTNNVRAGDREGARQSMMRLLDGAVVAA